MSEILKEVIKFIPDPTKIASSGFEGANIIVYTSDKNFFLDDKGSIKNAVDAIKKRIELRADPSITMDLEKAKEVIENIIPKEAGISNIIFDPQRSRVIVEAEKPGLAIGKKGELLRDIKEKTLWTPLIHRTPAIRSKMIENIRQVLYENNDFRRKFLDKVGKRIYNGWIRGKKQEWVRISFLGGAREVGRSCLFLQTPESRILIDCGVNVAATTDENAYPFLDAPEFKINEIDAIIVTHAHLDHSACVPLLMKYGYEGPIYCTAPTRDVMALLGLDYIGIAQKELKKSLFTTIDVKNMVKHTICLNYEEVFDITPDVRLTLYNAGHALGSSMVHLHIGNGLHNLLITGDLNYETSNLLAAAVTKFPRLETLIMESTYGGKEDNPATRKESEKLLLDIIKKTIDRKGKVLMPVLGVGRSQEIMLILEKAMREGLLKDVPIFVQGMVWDITAIHTAYPDFFNNNIKKLVFHQDKNPFTSEIFKKVGGHKEMMEVIEDKGPCVILATSGMMQGGASVEYFKHLADNPKNSLVLTSYQGPGSLGRRIQEGEKEIAFANGGGKSEIVPVKLDIHVIHGFTGHSTREQLTSFVHRLQPKPKKVILVHGESSKCLELASALHKLNRIETNAPKNLEAIRLK
jgi:uncharacterized protein